MSKTHADFRSRGIRVSKETLLIQVAADVRDWDTLAREVRSLLGAAADHPKARKILLAGSEAPRGAAIPEDVEPRPLWRWLLAPPAA